MLRKTQAGSFEAPVGLAERGGTRMKHVRALLSHRVILAVLVLTACAAVYMATLPKSDAIIVSGPGVWVYYSNGTYTTVVGARGTGCCGEVISWGVTTKWKKWERLYCLDVLCPN